MIHFYHHRIQMKLIIINIYTLAQNGNAFTNLVFTQRLHVVFVDLKKSLPLLRANIKPNELLTRHIRKQVVLEQLIPYVDRFARIVKLVLTDPRNFTRHVELSIAPAHGIL